MYPLRVFISYSHDDRKLARQVAEILESMGLIPVYDVKDIGASSAFTDSIKSLIAHAHVFMPLITKHSQKRPWVHQETGYAIAMNIPVLPVAIEKLPGQMIAQLQAISVKRNLKVLKNRLEEAGMERIVITYKSAPHTLVEVADWPEKRAEMMAQFANAVAGPAKYGMLRQRGALSSFCLPDKDTDDPIWDLREGYQLRSHYYRNLLREERRALELHAREYGCYLIIDPAIDFSSRGPFVTQARLSTLLDFLQSMPDDKAHIVMTERAREGSLTLVGDWFLADSMVPRPEGYRQTIFNWHAPTVLQGLNKFEREFKELLDKDGRGSLMSRQRAIEEMMRILDRLPKIGEKKG